MQSSSQSGEDSSLQLSDQAGRSAIQYSRTPMWQFSASRAMPPGRPRVLRSRSYVWPALHQRGGTVTGRVADLYSRQAAVETSIR